MTTTDAQPPTFDREAIKTVRPRTEEMRAAGARMVTIIARESEDGLIDLIYLFDRDGKVVDFRFTILPDQEVDSVADIYKAAINMEREVVDLFGLHFKGVQPGLLLELGKSRVAPLRKPAKAEAMGGEEDG